MEFKKNKEGEPICDICGKEVTSVYLDFQHKVSGHKNCIKSYNPEDSKQLELPLEE